MTHAIRDQRFNVGLTAVEVGLDDDPRVAELASQPAINAEGAFGVGRAFHINPHKVAQLSRPLDDTAHVLATEIFAQVEAHLGQFDGDVAIHSGGEKRVQRDQVLVGGRTCLGLGGDVFAQVIEGGQHPLGVDTLHGGDGICKRLAGHETPRHLP